MTIEKHQVNPLIKYFFNFVTYLEKEMASDNFNFSEMRILFELWENGVLSAKAIEQGLGLDKGYTSRLLNRLISDDIIQKTQSPDDKRFYDLTFTEKGQEVVSYLYNKYEKIIITDFDALDEAERRVFIKSLNALALTDDESKKVET